MEDLKNLFSIFVVDDSDFSRKMIIEILDKEGYKIVGEAASAEEAIKKSQSLQVNLFIVDIVMPEASGIDLVKTLNEFPNPICTLMMSSLTNENIIIEAISNGANDFLKKPFEPIDLIRSVDKILTYAQKEKMI